MGSVDNSFAIDGSLRVGFIGLGVMGWGMANNLRAKMPASASLHVCEISKQRLQDWLAQAPGVAKAAATPREVIEQSDIVITMLPAGSHVATVFNDPSTGMLSAAAQHVKDKTFLECSTIDIETSLSIAAEVRKLPGCKFIDAPVSGGVHGANSGTLSFMVGCDAPGTFDEVKGLLRLMGKPDNIFHCGAAGAGLATKQINNYLSCITMLGTCEAMTMGQLSGLDPAKLAGVIRVSTGACYNCGDQNPVRGVSDIASAARDFEGGFTTEMASGVLDMALHHGSKIGANLVLGDIVSDFYHRAASHPKCRGKDFRSIFKLFSESSGEGAGPE